MSRSVSNTAKLLDTWRVHQLARALSLRTVNDRERAVSQFAADADVAPHVATTSDVASWLARGQWTGSTRHTYWTHLNAWFTWLCLNGYRPDNPMTPLRAPKRPRYEPHPVSRANVEKLLTARTRPTTHAYLLLALYAGLRVSEIAALRGECFDLTATNVTVKGKAAGWTRCRFTPSSSPWHRRCHGRDGGSHHRHAAPGTSARGQSERH